MKSEPTRSTTLSPRRRFAVAGWLCALALSGCTREPVPPAVPSATPAAARDSTSPSPAAPPTPDKPAPDNTPASQPEPQASLPEPGAAGINTPQAAATAVETYFALLGARRTADADAMWGNPAQAATFRRDFAALGDYSVEVGAPGGIEAAAGSMYVTVPVRFIPAASVPNPRPRMGEVVVRRVNDVPGSTDAQRRWHIERIDVAMTPK